MTKGIVLLGHGSRANVDGANLLLLDMVASFKKQTGLEQVVPAWLNSKSERPGLMEAAEELVKIGCKEIVIAPWFLTNGLHLKEDIPVMIAGLETKFPQVRFAQAKHMGADPRMVDILWERIQEIK